MSRSDRLAWVLRTKLVLPWLSVLATAAPGCTPAPPIVIVVTTDDGSTGDDPTGDDPGLETTSSSGDGDPDTSSGDTSSGDTSSGDTAVEPSCGNGIVEAGETCDDEGESATCDDDCTPVDCGDGVLNVAAGEQCDDGGESEACDVDCTLAICGDGLFNATADEECDDGGRTAACNDDCTLAECGDGITNTTAGEACDDAGESAACNADCSPAACGDGITNTTAGETCDDAGPSVGCDADCTSVECGDSLLNTLAGEICDATELAGGTCEGLGYGSGVLACSAGCSYDASGCSPAVPTLTLDFSAIKRFDFSWTAPLGAEYHQLLESPALGEPYAQIGGDIVGESASFEMPLHLRLDASYVLRACSGGGCTDSAPVSVMGSLTTAVGYVKASNTEEADFFGSSVALSGDGNTLAVGAPDEDGNATGINGDQGNNSTQSGAVYVFVRSGLGTWTQQAYVKASNTGSGDRFGQTVALSDDGNTLAVGAPEQNSGAVDSGAAYVFVRDGMGVWSQQAFIKASNTGADDGFGYDGLALSGDGNTLAVGAPGEDSSATGIGGNQLDEGSLGSGAVYVFARSMGTWSQQAYVKASNTGANDRFGQAVTLSDDGSTLAVGAYQEDSSATGIGGNQADNGSNGSGAVYVLVRDGMGAWSQQAYVKASNTGGGHQFGLAVALSGDGDTLAVGARYESSNATGVGGDQADQSASQSGAAYVFIRDGVGAWSQQAYVKASNTDVDDYFGGSVALSGDGNTLAVGAIVEDGSSTGLGGDQADDTLLQSGAVYVLVRDDLGAWSQRAYVKASNPGPGDLFGHRVQLSASGNTLAVSANWERSSATGIGGNQADDAAYAAGAVYLY